MIERTESPESLQAIRKASLTGDVSKLKALVSADDNLAIDAFCKTPLHYAAREDCKFKVG
jgi:ankyrin repeat protein